VKNDSISCAASCPSGTSPGEAERVISSIIIVFLTVIFMVYDTWKMKAASRVIESGDWGCLDLVYLTT